MLLLFAAIVAVTDEAFDDIVEIGIERVIVDDGGIEDRVAAVLDPMAVLETASVAVGSPTSIADEGDREGSSGKSVVDTPVSDAVTISGVFATTTDDTSNGLAFTIPILVVVCVVCMTFDSEINVGVALGMGMVVMSRPIITFAGCRWHVSSASRLGAKTEDLRSCIFRMVLENSWKY